MKCFEGIRPDGNRRVGMTLLKAAALTLLLAIALPAMATNQRSVKMRVTPIYPEAAKHMRIAGPVQIDVTVDPDGKVTGMKTLGGKQVLLVAALDAVRQWKYAPSSSGTKESVVINFTYNN